MAQQLKKGMYGEEYNQTGNLFGLRCGQHRSIEKITHGSGWYNSVGEKIGWGDLSVKDFERISEELNFGEIFIVLSEYSSYWNFITKSRVIDDSTGLELKKEAPGIDYVAEHAIYLITKNHLFKIDFSGNEKKDFLNHNGLSFIVLKKNDVKNFITV